MARTAAARGLGRSGAALLALLLAALAGWIALARLRSAPAKQLARAAVPSGAILVAEIDVAALRAHPLARSLFAAPRPSGLDWKALCGGDPLDAVDRLAVAVPGEADLPFGLFATGRIDADWIARCAEAVLSRAQGTPPVRVREHGFIVVRGKGDPAGAALAVRDDGPLIVAEPGYLELAMRTASGGAPSAVGDPGHAELAGAEGALVVSVSLTRELRATLADELQKQGIAGSPFAAVRGGAVQVNFGADDTAIAVASIACDGPSAGARQAPCRQIGRIVESAIAGQSKTPLARALGYAALLDRLVVESSPAQVRIRGQWPLADLMAVTRRMLELARLIQRQD